jgi:hypothetical protein
VTFGGGLFKLTTAGPWPGTELPRIGGRINTPNSFGASGRGLSGGKPSPLGLGRASVLTIGSIENILLKPLTGGSDLLVVLAWF